MLDPGDGGPVTERCRLCATSLDRLLMSSADRSGLRSARKRVVQASSALAGGSRPSVSANVGQAHDVDGTHGEATRPLPPSLGVDDGEIARSGAPSQRLAHNERWVKPTNGIPEYSTCPQNTASDPLRCGTSVSSAPTERFRSLFVDAAGICRQARPLERRRHDRIVRARARKVPGSGHGPVQALRRDGGQRKRPPCHS